MIGAGPSHPVTKAMKNKNKANNIINSGEAMNNPYQNQLVQKPWIQGTNKKHSNGQ